MRAHCRWPRWPRRSGSTNCRPRRSTRCTPEQQQAETHSMAMVEVKVPDIGDFKDVEVIELLVKPGDTVKKEQSLITVESDKASMEIPSSDEGVVKEVKVKLGDKVSRGTPLVVLEGAGGAAAPSPATAASPPTPPSPQPSPASGRGSPTATLPPHEPAVAA